MSKEIDELVRGWDAAKLLVVELHDGGLSQDEAARVLTRAVVLLLGTFGCDAEGRQLSNPSIFAIVEEMTAAALSEAAYMAPNGDGHPHLLKLRNQESTRERTTSRKTRVKRNRQEEPK